MLKAETNTGEGVQASGHATLLPMTPALLAQARAAAAADHHPLIVPTHAVVREGRVIGYGSLGAVRMFYAWMDSQHATPRDSFSAWRQAEELLRAPYARPICLVCDADSPFAPFLKAKGYEVLGTSQICLKTLERK